MLEVVKVDGFKYLGSTIQTKGQCSKEVKKRVQAGECWWIQVSGLMSNRKKAARKIYKVVVRDAMMWRLWHLQNTGGSDEYPKYIRHPRPYIPRKGSSVYKAFDVFTRWSLLDSKFSEGHKDKKDKWMSKTDTSKETMSYIFRRPFNVFLLLDIWINIYFFWTKFKIQGTFASHTMRDLI